MAKVQIKGKTYITAKKCSDNCCVSLSKQGSFIFIADTKDHSLEPLKLDLQRWESFKVQVMVNNLDLTKLSETPNDTSYHGVSVRKVHSHILVCDTISDANHSLAFTLKEWNVFIEGLKEHNFTNEELEQAA